MGAKIGNPFIVGPPVPPSKFIGRKYEVKTILSRLANPFNQGGSAVHGKERIGRTSLLHYVGDPLSHGSQEALSADRCRFVYLDSHTLVQEVPETKSLEKSFWSHVFDDLTANLGEQAVQLKQAVLEDTLTDSQLAIFFQQLGENGYLVVVWLDEFDVLMEQVDPKNPRFFYRLRALLNKPAPRGFSLVVASRESLRSLFQDVKWRGSEFYNNLAFLPLGPFTGEEIDDLLDQYLEGTGIEFTEDERKGIKENSKGHPQRVQELAFDSFDRKAPETSRLEPEKEAQLLPGKTVKAWALPSKTIEAEPSPSKTAEAQPPPRETKVGLYSLLGAMSMISLLLGVTATVLGLLTNSSVLVLVGGIAVPISVFFFAALLIVLRPRH